MLGEPLVRLREAWDEPWAALGTPAFLGLSGVMAVLALLRLTSEDGWTAFLDGINLVFHEAGHPLFGLFGETLGILGGTLLQLLVPGAVTLAFWLRRHPASTALGGAWLFQNCWNISRYMADARAQVLPLAGGGEHDWALLFDRWGLLRADVRIAHLVLFLGWSGFLACWAWAAWRWHRARGGP